MGRYMQGTRPQWRGGGAPFQKNGGGDGLRMIQATMKQLWDCIPLDAADGGGGNGVSLKEGFGGGGGGGSLGLVHLPPPSHPQHLVDRRHVAPRPTPSPCYRYRVLAPHPTQLVSSTLKPQPPCAPPPPGGNHTHNTTPQHHTPTTTHNPGPSTRTIPIHRFHGAIRFVRRCPEVEGRKEGG